MRQLFISYARENKPDVEALVRDLDALGHRTWWDSSLRGGQAWWEEILRRTADSDVFVAIVSGHTLNSVACKRELEWALAVNKPVLPLAVRLRRAAPHPVDAPDCRLFEARERGRIRPGRCTREPATGTARTRALARTPAGSAVIPVRPG